MANAEQLYDKRIKDLESEIRNLKTAHFKTASKISTMTDTVGVSFSLYLDSASGEIYGDKRAIITLTTEDNSDMISACYVNNLKAETVDIDRFISVQRLTSDPGTIKYEVVIISTSYDDFITLNGGGSIDLDFTLTLVGSSRFTSSVAYRSYLGGSS